MCLWGLRGLGEPGGSEYSGGADPPGCSAHVICVTCPPTTFHTIGVCVKCSPCSCHTTPVSVTSWTWRCSGTRRWENWSRSADRTCIWAVGVITPSSRFPWERKSRNSPARRIGPSQRRVGRSQLLMLRRGDFPTRTCFGRRRCVEKRSPHQRSRGRTLRSTRCSRRTTIYQRPLR